MKEKLEKCYERLQHLTIQPTKDNLEILLQTLYDIKEVYNQLKEAEEHDGQTVNPEG